LTVEQQILETCRTIAVVGLSSSPLRPSYEVTKFMQKRGYRMVPVNPRETEVLGEPAYARLEDIPFKVDCVDVFRRAEFVPEIVESAIAIGAKALWLQLDVTHDTALARAQAAGLLAVQDRCLLIEYKRYFR
jgi:predicted CoA-binding protein